MIKIASKTNSQFINPAAYSVVWTCNSSSFFGSTQRFTSAEGSLTVLDLASKVKANDAINFTANITELKTKTVTVLSRVVKFSGVLPTLSVTSQADDTAADQLGTIKRVVTFKLSNLPSFVSSTQSSTDGPTVTLVTTSLADFYSANMKISLPVSGSLVVKFLQPPKAAQILVVASLTGATTSFNTTFTLNPTTNTTALAAPKNVDLTTITPTSNNIADVAGLISVKLGSQMASSGSTSSVATSSNRQTDCKSQGGIWVASNSTYGVDGFCNRTFDNTVTTQIQALADTTLTAFKADTAGSFSATDKLDFVKTLGSARTNGCPLTSSTVTSALESLSTVAKTISTSVSLSGVSTSSVGGVSVGSESQSQDLRTSMKGILQARADLTVPDAQTISSNTTDTTTVEAAKTNQRKSLTILDDVLSAFATARQTVGSSMTVSTGNETMHSRDVCLDSYSTLNDTDWISFSIDPKDGATSDTDITTTTKFGFHVSKETFQKIIRDKTVINSIHSFSLVSY